MRSDLERYRGKWVALDRDDDQVVADAPSLEQLQEELADSPDLAVLIRRIPAPDDPIFVAWA